MDSLWGNDDKECLAEGTDPTADDRARHGYCTSCPVGLCACTNHPENNSYSDKKRTSQSENTFYRSNITSSSRCFCPQEPNNCRCCPFNDTGSCYGASEPGSCHYGSAEENGSYCCGSSEECCNYSTLDDEKLSATGSSGGCSECDFTCQYCQYNNSSDPSTSGSCSSQSFSPPKAIQIRAKILFGGQSAINNLLQKQPSKKKS